MSILMVVRSPNDWPIDLPEVEVVSSKDYLTRPEWVERRNLKVFNLSRDYSYQSSGYYVSLLAEARGHRPLPSVPTLVDLQSPSLVRVISEELDQLIQKSLAGLQSEQFEFSVYFARNLAQKHARLAKELYNLFPAPMLRARFVKKDKWQLRSINVISGNEIKPGHHEFVLAAAREYFSSKSASGARRKNPPRFYLAVLVDPNNQSPPSDERAIKRFIKAAAARDIGVDLITRDDYGHLAEYDGLFIRETTQVNHYTYRFARKAEAEGLVVIDDPKSILHCTNKVFLTQLLTRHGVKTPKTEVVHPTNAAKILANIKYPCIIKQPDSFFSLGVFKAESFEEAQKQLASLFEKSDLLLVQEFMPTPFDWRVGVLDGEILFVCKYYMAGKHWQIVQNSGNSSQRYGKVETIPILETPAIVRETALRAAGLIGRGLYGVDIKEQNGRAYVVEINDNPNIDSGLEDGELGAGLYDKIVDYFLTRLEQQYGIDRKTPVAAPTDKGDNGNV